MSKIKLPCDWTAIQARIVYEFLEDIQAKIFADYGERIEELCREECWDECEESTKSTGPNFDDDIEF